MFAASARCRTHERGGALHHTEHRVDRTECAGSDRRQWCGRRHHLPGGGQRWRARTRWHLGRQQQPCLQRGRGAGQRQRWHWQVALCAELGTTVKGAEVVWAVGGAVGGMVGGVVMKELLEGRRRRQA